LFVSNIRLYPTSIHTKKQRYICVYTIYIFQQEALYIDSLSLSLSLSHTHAHTPKLTNTHTHTHTHTYIHTHTLSARQSMRTHIAWECVQKSATHTHTLGSHVADFDTAIGLVYTFTNLMLLSYVNVDPMLLSYVTGWLPYLYWSFPAKVTSIVALLWKWPAT